MIPIFLSCSYTFSPISIACSRGLSHPAVACLPCCLPCCFAFCQSSYLNAESGSSWVIV